MSHFLNTLKWVSLVAGLMAAQSLAAAQPLERAEEDVGESVGEGAINAVLRTATIYVKDWEASMRFYRDYLGYELMGEQPVTAQKSLDTIGVGEGGTARIAYLKPRNDWIKRPFVGTYMALVELGGPALEDRSYERVAPATQAIRGEIILVHEVAGIDGIYAAMQQDATVMVVSPLSLSGTGRSRSFSAIDPNGVRVEMYEYNPDKEPAENP